MKKKVIKTIVKLIIQNIAKKVLKRSKLVSNSMMTENHLEFNDIWGWAGRKSKNKILNDVKSAEEFIHDIQFSMR